MVSTLHMIGALSIIPNTYTAHVNLYNNIYHPRRNDPEPRPKRDIDGVASGAIFTPTEAQKIAKAKQDFEKTLKDAAAQFLKEIPPTLSTKIIEQVTELENNPAQMARTLNVLSASKADDEVALKPIRQAPYNPSLASSAGFESFLRHARPPPITAN